jgi:hypothetical protein
MIGLEADLVAESAGLRLVFGGSGSVLTCRIEGDAAGLFTTLRQSAKMLSLARALAPILQRAGIRFEVSVGERRIAQAGSGVRQNALARLLRLPAVHIGA